MKKRISLTISPDLIKEVEKYVDGIIVRSRSEAVESLLKEIIESRKTAVILAGGSPNKLYIPKLKTYRPLVKLHKKPIILHNIEVLKDSGFKNIYIIAQPKILSEIFNFLGDGKKLDVNLEYVQEKKELGTAKTLELVKKNIKSSFLVMPCDDYIGFDLKNLINYHRTHRGKVTLAVYAYKELVKSLGMVEMEGNIVVNYEEKPKNLRSHLRSTFIFISQPEVFSYIPPGEINWSLQENVFPKLIKEKELYGHLVSGKWFNIHTHEDAKEANELLKKRKVR